MTHLAELTDCGSPPAVDYCDPKITSAVDEAYEAVWAIIQNCDPSNGAKTKCEREADLSQTIGALVVDGVTDPGELRDKALVTLNCSVSQANPEIV